MEKNIEIKLNNPNTIKINTDKNDLHEDNICGRDDIEPNIVKKVNKSVCYKCKVNNSQFYNRNEYTCRLFFCLNS